MDPVFIEEDGKTIGVGIGTAIHTEVPGLEEAMQAAANEVLEECRKEGIIWTHPDEVVARKLEAFRKVREEFNAG